VRTVPKIRQNEPGKERQNESDLISRNFFRAYLSDPRRASAAQRRGPALPEQSSSAVGSNATTGQLRSRSANTTKILLQACEELASYGVPGGARARSVCKWSRMPEPPTVGTNLQGRPALSERASCTRSRSSAKLLCSL